MSEEKTTKIEVSGGIVPLPTPIEFGLGAIIGQLAFTMAAQEALSKQVETLKAEIAELKAQVGSYRDRKPLL